MNTLYLDLFQYLLPYYLNIILLIIWILLIVIQSMILLIYFAIKLFHKKDLKISIYKRFRVFACYTITLFIIAIINSLSLSIPDSVIPIVRHELNLQTKLLPNSRKFEIDTLFLKNITNISLLKKTLLNKKYGDRILFGEHSSDKKDTYNPTSDTYNPIPIWVKPLKSNFPIFVEEFAIFEGKRAGQGTNHFFINLYFFKLFLFKIETWIS